MSRITYEQVREEDNSNKEKRNLRGEIERLKEELRISQGIREDKYKAPEAGWTCYHCGITFRKPGAARDHFGEVPRNKPKCQYHDLDVEKLEKEVAGLRARMKVRGV